MQELFPYDWWTYCFQGDSNMQRINLNQFYAFGHAIRSITNLEADKQLKDYLSRFHFARIWLDWFIEDKMIPMVICKEAASRIIQEVDQLAPKSSEIDTGRVLSYDDLFSVMNAAREFETVFSAEVSNKATYFVSKKGIYDTNDLIASAEDLFVQNIKQDIDKKAIADIREAGKCLAFDLATACGFHIARAVETVLLDYLTLLCPRKIKVAKRAQRNLGNYIRMARDNHGDDKICAALDQFRDLHRNPLMHPEATLSVDEAFSLLGIAQSAIVALVTQIQQLRNPPIP